MKILRLLPVLLLAACGSAPRPQDPGPSLASLPPATLPDEVVAAPPSLASVQRRYEELLAEPLPPERETEIKRRLADLAMADAEAALAEGRDAATPLRQALDYYEDLQQRPGAAADVLLYQRAKSHELLAEVDVAARLLDELARRHPDSRYAAEARFRWAEFRFAAGDYAGAESAYAAVVDAYADSPLYEDALYMLGWSRFKRFDYYASLAAFADLLDRAYPADDDLEALAPGKRSQIDDTLRVMAMAGAEFGEAQALLELDLADRHWQVAMYRALGDHYLERERYQDAAGTWQAFLREQPLHPAAPELHQRLIATWEQGDYPSEVLPEKERFVKAYGIRGAFWPQAEAAARAELEGPLRQFLGELAREAHAQAQSLRAAEPPDPDGSRLAFRAAAGWYRETLDTFPQAEDAADTAFLLGEALFDAGDYVDAIDAYETVAYEFPPSPQGAEAAYAALLAFQRLETADDEVLASAEILSQLRFARTYPADERVVPALARAATRLLQLEQYADALEAAGLMLARDDLAPEPRRTALEVRANAAFASADYVLAESALQALLALGGQDAAQRARLLDRLAATVYQQAELAMAAGDTDAAIGQFLRIAEVAPDTEARRQAQFEASTLLLQEQRWQRAVPLLLDYRQRYAEGEDIDEINRRLVLAYENSGRWLDAAAELRALEARQPASEPGREALYLAAEYLRKGGDEAGAIAVLGDYAQRYPQPYDLRIEALAGLIELHAQRGESDERRRWQRRLVEIEAQAQPSTDRARFLAAQATLEFAEEAAADFASQALGEPLARSLRAKRERLGTAVDLYQRLAGYGVVDFTTRATHAMAELYRGLAAELLDLPPPSGLNALEQEQYLVLLEEQAIPFEDLAIELHETNAARARQELWDEWIAASFEALRRLVPARYARDEEEIAYATQFD